MSATVSAPSTVTEGWPHIACKLDKGPASRAAIGLITLANDLTIENELNRFLSIDGVCVLSTRIPRTSHGTVSSLQDMEQHLTEASKLITPDEHLDVIAYGCTSGSMAIGPEVVAERIHAARPEVACANPVSASLKGLRALDCQQIAVLNPLFRRGQRGGGALRYRSRIRRCGQSQLRPGWRPVYWAATTGGHLRCRIGAWARIQRASAFHLLHRATGFADTRPAGSGARQTGGEQQPGARLGLPAPGRL